MNPGIGYKIILFNNCCFPKAFAFEGIQTSVFTFGGLYLCIGPNPAVYTCESSAPSPMKAMEVVNAHWRADMGPLSLSI